MRKAEKVGVSSQGMVHKAEFVTRARSKEGGVGQVNAQSHTTTIVMYFILWQKLLGFLFFFDGASVQGRHAKRKQFTCHKPWCLGIAVLCQWVRPRVSV